MAAGRCPDARYRRRSRLWMLRVGIRHDARSTRSATRPMWLGGLAGCRPIRVSPILSRSGSAAAATARRGFGERTSRVVGSGRATRLDCGNPRRSPRRPWNPYPRHRLRRPAHAQPSSPVIPNPPPTRRSSWPIKGDRLGDRPAPAPRPQDHSHLPQRPRRPGQPRRQTDSFALFAVPPV